MKSIIKFLLLFILLFTIGGYLWFGSVQGAWTKPLGNSFSFEVKRGTSLKGLIHLIGEQVNIPQKDLAYYYFKYQGLSGLKTGNFDANENDSLEDIIKKTIQGNVSQMTFQVIEGSNRWDNAEYFAKKGLMSKNEFNRLCDDNAFLESEEIPGPNCEGYLFPETYKVAKGTTAKGLFKVMFSQFKKEMKNAVKNAKMPVKLSPKEFVTLTSIVEKETGAPSERPRIACLFYNRLKANPPWKLQTDPTVIYAAKVDDPSFDGNIKKWHLTKLMNPYNTYTNEGFPPGPIANAGRAAFNAVANPASCKDFFFVSKNDGTHVFCPTLACHEKNVDIWQRQYFRKKKQQQ